MISAVVYDADRGVREYDDVGEAKAARGTTLVSATDASRAELEEVADTFGVHPLVVEDVINNVRPKTEEFTEHTFALLKDADLRRGEQVFEEEIDDRAVGVVLGVDWVLVLATGPVEAVDRVREAVVRGDDRLLQRGADFTAYRIFDHIVDEYFDILDLIEDAIEVVEEEVTVSTDIDTLESINSVRRDLLAFRKIVWPAREALGAFARGDPPQVRDQTEKYYRDVYEHLVQVVDLLETYRDLTTGARDIYLNTVSQSTNEVMKTLTVVATIFLPLTFVVGVYGMNFGGSRYNMPELAWTFGYPAVLLGMLLVALVMLAQFRRQQFI